MRLLKQKGIQLHRVRGQLNAEEETKSKLFAKYERRKKRQSERHVLRREMATHAIPRLFVSRRTDKNPNGFNCAICRKDVSFLSRGELEIWRHFGRKTHFAKDRRYRLDHEDFIYTEKFDEIAVATISPELRAEIELTPPVVLGPKNAFEEDEVDALVGVVSNVPCSTLVGGLFELLRSGGSHSFLRRLWSQFRTTIPVETSYAQATWSKTESFVILCQTLYPRILRRVQSGCKLSDFSISFRRDDTGVQCYVHFFASDVVREVCVLWEEVSPGLCDAEIKCLTRVLAILPIDQSPVAVRGCPSTLFNVFSSWCKDEGRPVPLPVLEYTPDVFREHVREAGLVGANLLDPFAILDYLLLRLVRAVHQPWLESLPTFRVCISQRQVPFPSLRAAISELIHHWADVTLFLKETGTVLPSKGKAPLDVGQLIVSDTLVLPRLSVLHVLVACFEANFVKQFDESVTDYTCRNYADFCYFYWSLLGKVKKLSSLPEIEAWSQYIGRPLTTWANIPFVECLRGEPLVTVALSACGDAVRRPFLRECHGFLSEFLKVLNQSAYAKSVLSSNLSCFSPDMMLLGDESYAVQLFKDLTTCLLDCGRLASLDCEAASNEFKSLLVELRRRNQRVVSLIKDSFVFLRDSGLLDCRLNLDKVVQIAALAMVPRCVNYPVVDMSLSGALVPKKILLSSIFACQSYVTFRKFASGELLTRDCLEELKTNLPNGKGFMEDASFAPWRPLYAHARCDMYRRLRDAFDAYYLDQVSEWRRRAGLGLYAATASPDKLLPELQFSHAASVVEENVGTSSAVNTPPSVKSVGKTVKQAGGSGSIAEINKMKKDLRQSGVSGSSSGKGSSSGSVKRGSGR